jgi:hypothetical protein
MIRGTTGSNSSEGSNKCFSSKQRIPILKTTNLVINRMQKTETAGQIQGEERHSQINVT